MCSCVTPATRIPKTEHLLFVRITLFQFPVRRSVVQQKLLASLDVLCCKDTHKKLPVDRIQRYLKSAISTLSDFAEVVYEPTFVATALCVYHQFHALYCDLGIWPYWLWWHLLAVCLKIALCHFERQVH